MNFFAGVATAISGRIPNTSSVRDVAGRRRRRLAPRAPRPESVLLRGLLAIVSFIPTDGSLTLTVRSAAAASMDRRSEASERDDRSSSVVGSSLSPAEVIVDWRRSICSSNSSPVFLVSSSLYRRTRRSLAEIRL